MEILEKYKEQILEKFEQHCQVFKLIGSPEESPSYYNIGRFDKENYTQRFESTQNSKLFFDIEIEGGDYRDFYHMDTNEAWQWFKQVRTNYLIDNHPTIDARYPYFQDLEVQEREIKETLVNMLKENTGKHFLDSGGDDGRMWQRNQEKDFESEPEVEIEYWDGKYSSVTVSTYHYLKQVLECDEESDKITAILRQEDWHWVSEVEIDRLQALTNWDIQEKGEQWNTYNGENNLSQILQGQFLEINGDYYVLLQIHGGADVRGGYTDVQCFKLVGMLDGWVMVTLQNEEKSIDLRYPSDYEMIDLESNEYTTLSYDELEDVVREDGNWEGIMCIMDDVCL